MSINPMAADEDRAGSLVITPRRSIIRKDFLGRPHVVASTEPWRVKFYSGGRTLFDGTVRNDTMLRIVLPPGRYTLRYSLLWRPHKYPWAKDIRGYCTEDYAYHGNPLPVLDTDIKVGKETPVHIVDSGGKKHYYETRDYYPPIAVEKSYQIIRLVEKRVLP